MNPKYSDVCSLSGKRQRRPGAGQLAALGCAMCFAFAPEAVLAQAPPHVTGAVQIELDSGTLSADMCLSGVPVRGDSVSLILNRSLAIRRITGVHPAPVTIEEEPAGGAVRYTWVGATPRQTGGRDAPTADVCVVYGGIHPVHDVSAARYRPEDASDLIAFNGSTIRARGASRWHPTVYVPRTGLSAETVTFDIDVECVACDLIYVNGGHPAAGPRASFDSEAPRELLLVAGKLELSEWNGFLAIGEVVESHDLAMLHTTIRSVVNFLDDYLGVPYGPMPTLVRLDPLRRPREGQLWGFFSDPALVLLGMPISQLVTILHGPDEARRRTLMGFLAHELSHRYFGWSPGPDSALRDLFGEPFATFLELKAVGHFFGANEYGRAVDRLRTRVITRSGTSPPLGLATAADFASSDYRYGYSPLMLLALEEAIGEERMRALLRDLINALSDPQARGDLTLLRASAIRAGVPENVWDAWEDGCAAAVPHGGACLGQPELENLQRRSGS